MSNKRYDPLIAGFRYVDLNGAITMPFRTQYDKITEDLDGLMDAAEAVLTGTASYEPPSIAAMGTTTTTIAVPGAVLGSPVVMSFTRSLSGIMLSGYVSAANLVTATFFNPTAGAIDLGDGTLTARVG